MARAAEQAAKYSATVRMQREDAQWRIKQLKRSREQTASQLADARLELGHLEDHARRLRSQLGQYEKTVDGVQPLGKCRSPADRPDTKRNSNGSVRRSASRNGKLPRAQGRHGPQSLLCRGPLRRPEPDASPADLHRVPPPTRVVLQPEGIVFTESDFDGPMGPGNPLAAALRAAREHLLAGRDFDPLSGEPYPLLLVRPEGINGFYAARMAMKSWGGDFGYELIGDDWKLAYQRPIRSWPRSFDKRSLRHGYARSN